MMAEAHSIFSFLPIVRGYTKYREYQKCHHRISAAESLSSYTFFPLIAGGQAYKLIMEYVPLGSLKEYLPRHKKGTSLNTLLNYSMQICKVRLVSVALRAKLQTAVLNLFFFF